MPSTESPVQTRFVRGWTPARQRRVRMLAVLLAGVAAVALWSSLQSWYGFATAGVARCDTPSVKPTITMTTPRSNAKVSGVYASGCISGRGIATEAELQTQLDAQAQRAQQVLDATNTSKMPATMLGLPRTVTLVVLASLIGAAGLVLRNGFITFAGFVGFYYAHRDLATLQTLMTSGVGGSLNTPQQGLYTFGWALLFGWGLLVASMILVLKHNADTRHRAKRAALAAGETPAPGPLDHVAAFAGSRIAQVKNAVDRETERRSNRPE